MFGVLSPQNGYKNWKCSKMDQTVSVHTYNISYMLYGRNLIQFRDLTYILPIYFRHKFISIYNRVTKQIKTYTHTLIGICYEQVKDVIALWFDLRSLKPRIEVQNSGSTLGVCQNSCVKFNLKFTTSFPVKESIVKKTVHICRAIESMICVTQSALRSRGN